MALKAWHIPVRLATGAFILNSGLSKREVDEETARHNGHADLLREAADGTTGE